MVVLDIATYVSAAQRLRGRDTRRSIGLTGVLSRDAAQALQPVWVLDFGIDDLWKALAQAVVARLTVEKWLAPTVLANMNKANHLRKLVKSSPIRSGLHAGMSEEDLLHACHNLYIKQGFEGLTVEALQAEDKLYTTLYHRGINQSVLIEKLGLRDAYRDYQKSLHKVGTIHSDINNAALVNYTYGRIPT